MISAFRRFYGASPLHLAGHLGVFFIAGWAIDQILDGGFVVNYLAWILGALLLHDLVALPLYSAIGLGMQRVTRTRDGGRGLVNYVRVPAAIGGILLLVYFPLIFGLSSKHYRADTGHALAGYTRNWLLICAGLFLLSGLVLVARAGLRESRTRRDR